jgi:hypothetical protein
MVAFHSSGVELTFPRRAAALLRIRRGDVRSHDARRSSASLLVEESRGGAWARRGPAVPELMERRRAMLKDLCAGGVRPSQCDVGGMPLRGVHRMETAGRGRVERSTWCGRRVTEVYSRLFGSCTECALSFWAVGDRRDRCGCCGRCRVSRRTSRGIGSRRGALLLRTKAHL